MSGLERRFLDFVKSTSEHFDRLSTDVYNLREFAESFLLLLLDIAIKNDPVERLISVFLAATFFPQPILERYVENAVKRAYLSSLPFEKLSDALLKGLEEKVKQTVSVELIAKTYGMGAAKVWREILGESSPNPGYHHGVKQIERTIRL